MFKVQSSRSETSQNVEPGTLNLELLVVFAPPGSPLDRQSVMIIPLTMNNAARAQSPGRYAGVTMQRSRR